MRGWGINITEAKLSKIIEKIDPEKKGMVKFDDYLDVMSENQSAPGLIEDVITEAFAVFDKEKNGTVNTGELKHVLCKMGEFMTAQEVDGLLKEAEADAEGNIKYKDFMQSLNDQYGIF